MKCPACELEGERSIVHVPGGGISTAMWCDPWYDEDGVYHNHDGNTFTASYSCSRNHYWSVSTTPSCPAGDQPGTTHQSEPEYREPKPVWSLNDDGTWMVKS